MVKPLGMGGFADRGATIATPPAVLSGDDGGREVGSIYVLVAKLIDQLFHGFSGAITAYERVAFEKSQRETEIAQKVILLP